MHYYPAEHTLDIAFRDGRGVYRYFDVPHAMWEAFRSAPSKGTYLNQIFKAGGYGYEKLPCSHGPAAIGQPSAGLEEELFWGEAPHEH